jgi:hypothetical protein
LVAVVILAALGCSEGQALGRSGVVSAVGTIGPLQLDRSTRAEIGKAAGHPDVEIKARTQGGQDYDALGYQCSAKAGQALMPIRGDGEGGPYCRTGFYVNLKTRRLETFFTTSEKYSESHGVHIGMSTTVAERLLHKRRQVGCDTDIYVYGMKATLTVAFVGGTVKQASHVVGGHVFGFFLHSKRGDISLFDCL